MFVSSTGLREQRQEQASRIEAERWPRTPDFSVYFPLPPSLVASGLNLIYLLLHVHVNVPVFSDPEHSRSHKLTHKVNASTFWIFNKKKKEKHARSLRDSCIIGVWMIVQSFVKKMKRDKRVSDYGGELSYQFRKYHSTYFYLKRIHERLLFEELHRWKFGREILRDYSMKYRSYTTTTFLLLALRVSSIFKPRLQHWNCAEKTSFRRKKITRNSTLMIAL